MRERRKRAPPVDEDGPKTKLAANRVEETLTRRTSGQTRAESYEGKFTGSGQMARFNM